MKTIAYLAPEIPALSATFVYNEIIALQKKGYTVIPISVHVPSSPVTENRVSTLTEQTHYLYKEKGLITLMANLTMLCTAPLRYIKAWCTAFSDALRVRLFTRVGLGLIYRVFMASRVAVILQENKCTHLHANFAHIPTDIGMYAAQLANIPFSFTSHANDIFERGWLLPQKVARSKFAVTISEFNKAYLTSKGGASNKIHVVRCGVESKTFTRKTSTPCSPPYQIGTLGRMVEKKGFDILLRAAVSLRRKDIAFQIIIAGNGPLEKKLKALAHHLDIQSHIQFIGPLPHKDVSAWLKTLDLFVLPCQKDCHGDMDGIPVVLMEAMLTGTPVISTKISGIPELISHKKNGLLVKPQDVTELANAMEKLLSDPALRAITTENGIKRVLQEFDIELNINRLELLLGR